MWLSLYQFCCLLMISMILIYCNDCLNCNRIQAIQNHSQFGQFSEALRVCGRTDTPTSCLCVSSESWRDQRIQPPSFTMERSSCWRITSTLWSMKHLLIFNVIYCANMYIDKVCFILFKCLYCRIWEKVK